MKKGKIQSNNRFGVNVLTNSRIKPNERKPKSRTPFIKVYSLNLVAKAMQMLLQAEVKKKHHPNTTHLIGWGEKWLLI